MKSYILKTIVLIFILPFLWSCSEEENNSNNTPGAITVRINKDTSVLTKAEGDDIITLRIQETNSEWKPISGEPALEYTLSEGDHDYEFPAGHYLLTAVSGTDTKGKPTSNPYYVGADSVILESGKQTTAVIECKLTTVVIKVNYEHIANYYSAYEYETIVSTAGGESITFTKDDKELSGYFLPGELSVTFRYGNGGNWQEKEMKGISALKAQYEYIITYTMKDSEGGDDDKGSAGIGISVDDDPENQQGNIEIKLPKVDYSLYISEDIGEVYAKISAEAFLNNEHEVTSLTFEYKEENEGDWTELQVNGINGQFVAELTGLHPGRNYQVRIKEDHLTSKTFQTKEIQYKFNSWATFSFVSANTEQIGLINSEFEYRKVGTQDDWLKIDSDSDHNSRLINLESGTEYECRLIANDMIGNICVFKTEEAKQLPNSGFEDWQKPGYPWLIYAGNESNKFWDSGNEGATTLNSSGSVTTPDSTTYVHSGSRSAKLASRNVVLKFAAGNLFAGEYVDTDGTDGILDFGRPFESRPSKFRLWYRYTSGKINYPSGGWLSPFPSEVIAMGTNRLDPDMMHIYIAVGDWDEPVRIRTKSSVRKLFEVDDPNIIAYGEHISSQSTTIVGFEELIIDLVYRDMSRKPKYIVVVCSASRFGDYFAGSDSSVLYLDDFELIYDDEPTVKSE